jgi:hypothetical protein
MKMNPKDVGYKDVNDICMPQDRDHWWAVVDTVMDLPVPYKVGKFLNR